jgi:hypothetical protein
MSDLVEALRVPMVACAISLMFVLGSWAGLDTSLRQVAEGTGAGSCGSVPWLRLVGPCRGIVLLELAPNPDSAWRLVDTLRSQDQAATTKPTLIQAAETSVRLDYFLIPSYVAFLGFLGMVAVRLAEVRESTGGISPRAATRLTKIVSWAVGLQLIAGVLDGIENVGLFTMLEATGPGDIPGWTWWASTVKWWLIGPGLLLPLLALTWLATRGGSTAKA